MGLILGRYWDAKVAGAIFAILIVALMLAWYFGGMDPISDAEHLQNGDIASHFGDRDWWCNGYPMTCVPK
jgi:hypothetical protein